MKVSELMNPKGVLLYAKIDTQPFRQEQTLPI